MHEAHFARIQLGAIGWGMAFKPRDVWQAKLFTAKLASPMQKFVSDQATISYHMDGFSLYGLAWVLVMQP